MDSKFTLLENEMKLLPDKFFTILTRAATSGMEDRGFPAGDTPVCVSSQAMSARAASATLIKAQCTRWSRAQL